MKKYKALLISDGLSMNIKKYHFLLKDAILTYNATL